jgi:hypothetical protein
MANIKGPAIFLLLIGLASAAHAQQPAPGFSADRFYQSAPGSGWFVMDDLNSAAGLGGTISLTTDYAAHPLAVTSADGIQRLLLVSDQAYLNIGAAMSYNRLRGYFYFPLPLAIDGNSGTVGGYRFSAPSFSIGSDPDTATDPVMGVDLRLLGQANARLRLGVNAQLIFPSGNRADYDTDGKYRDIVRFLAAGDSGQFSYAGELGVQARSLNNPGVPGGPHGNEFLFGASGGRSVAVTDRWSLMIGPEIFGETAFNSFYALQQTGAEGLLTARLGQSKGARRVHVKVGVGHGIMQHFGAPEWRFVLGVEVSGERDSSARD